MNVDRNASKLALSELKGDFGQLEGTILATEFVRIPTEISLVKDVNFQFKYQLVEAMFYIQLEGVGKFKAKCQRCLEKFTFFEKIEIRDSMPVDLQKKRDDEEILLNDNGEIDLIKTLEDEFLLCLPMVPKHDIDDCNLHMTEADDSDSELEGKKTPFSVLKDLL